MIGSRTRDARGDRTRPARGPGVLEGSRGLSLDGLTSDALHELGSEDTGGTQSPRTRVASGCLGP